MNISELPGNLQSIIENTKLINNKKKAWTIDELKALWLAWENSNKHNFAKQLGSYSEKCKAIYAHIQEENKKGEIDWQKILDKVNIL